MIEVLWGFILYYCQCSFAWFIDLMEGINQRQRGKSKYFILLSPNRAWETCFSLSSYGVSLSRFLKIILSNKWLFYVKEAEEGDRAEKLEELLKRKTIHFRSEGSTRPTLASAWPKPALCRQVPSQSMDSRRANSTWQKSPRSHGFTFCSISCPVNCSPKIWKENLQK